MTSCARRGGGVQEMIMYSHAFSALVASASTSTAQTSRGAGRHATSPRARNRGCADDQPMKSPQPRGPPQCVASPQPLATYCGFLTIHVAPTVPGGATRAVGADGRITASMGRRNARGLGGVAATSCTSLDTRMSCACRKAAFGRSGPNTGPDHTLCCG